MENKITLKNVRLAFPQLFEAKQVNGEGKPAFSASLLMSPDDPQVDAVNELIDAIAAEKWGAKAKAMLAAIRGKDGVAIHNGDLKSQYEGFEGNYFVSARSYVKVLVLDRDKTHLTPADGRPYAGCFVDASIEVWAQDNKWGKRVNASLRWVQFRRDGDAFSGSPPPSDEEIDDIAVIDDGDDLV